MIISEAWTKTENFGSFLPHEGDARGAKRRRLAIREMPAKASLDRFDTRGFDVVSSMHDGFTETLKAMSSDKGKEKVAANAYGPRQHPLYKSIMHRQHVVEEQKCTKPLPELELVLRADEEAFMRPARTGETPCASGASCEGRLIARYVYEGAVEGFTCPAFVLPAAQTTCNDLCVLCLRKAVSVQLYTLRSWNAVTPCVILPYRNVVEVEGEYRAGACLYPSRRAFEGVSDPFLRHHRHRYVYQDGVIRHTDTVLHFCEAPLHAPCSPASSER